MLNLVKTFSADDRGATAIEYAMVAGLIAVIIIAALSVIGDELGGIFYAIANVLRNVTGG